MHALRHNVVIRCISTWPQTRRSVRRKGSSPACAVAWIRYRVHAGRSGHNAPQPQQPWRRWKSSSTRTCEEDHEAATPDRGDKSTQDQNSATFNRSDIQSSTLTGPSFKASTPSSVSSRHDSLESFHVHALRVGLSPASTVYTGTRYEYLSQSALRPYGLQLTRVGGRGDRGIDLVGFWAVPRIDSVTQEWVEHEHVTDICQSEIRTATDTFRVLVQCKRIVGRSGRIGPNLMRELDGAVRSATTGMWFETTGTLATNHKGGPVLGVLVGTRPATKGVLESMRRSSRGLVWIMMEETIPSGGSLESGDSPEKASESGPEGDEEDAMADSDPDPDKSAANITGRVKQIVWNQAARSAGLEGLDVVKRYDSSGNEEVVLMKGGRVWGGAASGT